jgi:hypothetical protein
MHSDIKNFWKTKTHPNMIYMVRSNQLAKSMFNTYRDDVCLSIERVDKPVPIILLRNGKQIN